jgi:hypothetical protein
LDPKRRLLFNAAYTPELFARVMKRLESGLGPFPFRVAETPLILTHELRDQLARDGVEILKALSEPRRLAELSKAIPPRYDVPRMDELPNCVQVDFALTRAPGGGLQGKVVELQAFPSLYALMVFMADAWAEQLNGIAGLREEWTCLIDMDRDRGLDLMRRTIVGSEDPAQVALVDLEPDRQKTSPDFVATQGARCFAHRTGSSFR